MSFTLGPQLTFPDYSLFPAICLTLQLSEEPLGSSLSLLWLMFLLPVEPPPTFGVVRSADPVSLFL